MTVVDFSTTLAPTALGGLLALGGGFLGQWWGERRAVAREARDRDHEREVWARGLRREAHLAFITEFERKFKKIDEWHAIPYDGSEPDHDYLETILDTLTPMRLVAGNETPARAWDAIMALKDYTFGSTVPATRMDVAKALDAYLQSVRDEFGLKTPMAHEDSG